VESQIPENIYIYIWLVEQKAILTNDNMIRRKWQGDPGCCFCGMPENCDHLLFECPIAKVIWGVTTICFQQNTRPSSYDQFWISITKALPGGDKVYMLGFAAICWAIWRTRNEICLSYWAGLYPEDTQKLIKDGVDLMMKTAIRLLGKKSGNNSATAPALMVREAATTEVDDEAGQNEETRDEN
jgi:hypothetical protein